MKKFSLILMTWMFPVVCSAQDLSAYTLAAGLERVRTLSEAGDHKGAFAHAQELCKINCSNIALNFALLNEAMRIGEYDAALAASDRILVYEPNNITAHFVAAKIYKEQGNYELYRAELEQIAAFGGLSAEHRALLAALSASEHQPYGMLSIGGGYESNPQHQTSKDFYFHTIIGDFKIPAPELEGAGYGNINAQLGVRTQLSERTFNDFSVFSYNKYFFKPRDKGFSDISVLSAQAALNHQTSDRVGSAISLGYDHAWLRGRVYSKSLSLDASATALIGQKGSLTMGLRGGMSFFEDEQSDDSYNLGLYLQLVRSINSGYLYARAAFNSEKAERSANISSDFSQASLALGGKKQLSTSFAARVSATYSHNFYRKYHSAFQNYRADDALRGELVAEYALGPGVIELGAGYAHQRSNQALYSYSNATGFLNYRLAFN